jgi:hypothetical protein
MDDGSIKSRESKSVIFNTQGFIRNEVEQLVDVLRRNFKLEAKLQKQKEGFQIYISGNSYELFRELVDEYIHPSMRYKISPVRKTQMPKL